MVRSSLPSKICDQLPTVINEKLSSKTNNIPQSIPLSQLLQSLMNALGLNNLLGSAGGSIGVCFLKKF